MEDDVVILLATRNGAKYLPEQLDSIARQTYPNWRLVAADDGSTDSTVELLERFGKAHHGRLVILPTTPVHSAKNNFFRLLRDAPSARYYALCDQDDVWRDDKLEMLVHRCKMLEAAQDGALPCVVYSDLVVVDAALQIMAESFMQEISTDPDNVTFGSLLVENSIPGCSMLLNSHALRMFRTFKGPLDDAIMHDWWMALIGRAFGSLAFVPDTLVQYRQHGTNSAGSVRRRGLQFALKKLLTTSAGPLSNTYRQALLFQTAYSGMLPERPSRVLEAYARFDRITKIARVRACLRNGILKQTVIRRLYQLLRV